MVYRAEIDGLRAISVIAIVLLHAGFGFFSGGFVGVDIFFVISGYLITTILIEDIVNKKNNILYFYQRRARRILPALFFVLVITYIISWFIFLPGPHKVVGQYTVASIFSVSNFLLFLKGNNYFGLEQGQNPLFHTWSLGVEEQFYLLFPAFLFLTWSLVKQKIFLIIILLAAISFSLSELTRGNNPEANFYLLHSRIWELLAGSIASFIVWNRKIKSSNSLSILGLGAIFFSIFVYDKSTPFPSVYTLVPVIGTMLVIMYGKKGTLIAQLLSHKIFVNIGLVSYSVYLWHIPLLVYFSYIFSYQTIQFSVYFFSLTVLSWFSYRFVEMPFRTSISSRALLIFFIILASLLIFLGILGHKNDGFPNRSVIFSNLQINNGYGLNCNGNTDIVHTCSDNDNPDVAVLGNSYAMVYVNDLRKKKDFKVVQLTQDGCAVGFVDELKDFNKDPCKDFYEKAIKTINGSNSITKVIISSPLSKEMSNNLFKTSFANLLQLLNNKKDVYVIGPPPRAPFNVGECVFKRRFFGEKNCDFFVSDEHYNLINSLTKFFEGRHVFFLDITDVICPSGICKMDLGYNDAMYFDHGHLSVSGSKLILDNINLNFKNKKK